MSTDELVNSLTGLASVVSQNMGSIARNLLMVASYVKY